MTKRKDNKKAFIVNEVAELTGKKPNTVYKCISGVRDNDEVCAVYDEVKTGIERTIEQIQNNLLMRAVKELEI